MTSALNDNGIDRLFKEVGLKVMNKKMVKRKNDKINKNEDKDNKEKTGCC